MTSPSLYSRIIAALASLCSRLSLLVLLAAVVSAGLSIHYTIKILKFNSDTAQLVDQNKPFRRHYDDFLNTFPEYQKTILVVIDAPGPGQAKDAAIALAERLSADSDHFRTVYTPFLGPFFDRNAFLYLSPEKLEDLLNAMTAGQAVLVKLSADPSLRGVFGIVELGVQALENSQELPNRFVALTDMITVAIDDQIAGKNGIVDWSGQFYSQSVTAKRFILVQPRFDYSQAVPGKKATTAIRSHAEALGLTPDNGVKVRLTGEVALSVDEMQEIMSDTNIAGAISLLLVTFLVIYAMRSGRLIFAAMATLLIGLCWSLAYATVVVGELNMISASFNVLFLGLGIDHCLHLGLAYQQSVGKGNSGRDSIKRMILHSGTGVSMAGITSAIGFMSFWPTDYRGLADLGLIAGGAMLIAVFASFTVLPAFLAALKTENSPRMQRSFGEFIRWMRKGGRRSFDKQVAAATILLAIPAAYFTSQLSFNYSTLALKDPSSESYQTLTELEKEGVVTDYAVNVLASDLDEAGKLAEELRELGTVKEVRTPLSYVPKEQELKLSLLEDSRFFLDPALNPRTREKPPTVPMLVSEAQTLLSRITNLPEGSKNSEAGKSLQQFSDALKKLIAGENRESQLSDLDHRLTADLPKRLDELRLGLKAKAVSFDDLPEELRTREISHDGRARVVVVPKDDLSDGNALAKFVSDVTRVAPEATGRPILEAGVGKIVADAFWDALGLALIAITLILFISLRNIRDTLYALFPLLLAGALTMGMAELLSINLNFANIIVLPLLLGLGVGGAMHVVLQERANPEAEQLATSTTPRAILYSALTTAAAFVSLTFIGHRGIASMGLLLTIAITWCLVTTIIVLPAVQHLTRTLREDQSPNKRVQ
jgi:hopanoid biosynthesis associated RND transporter like protein HpnN